VVIVVPASQHSDESWKSGGGNYFFELLQSAKERYGEHAVDIFIVDENSPNSVWQASLAQFLVSTAATHCVAFVESDPGHSGRWNWGNFAALARRSWDGAFVGILTDGLYLLHQARATRFRHAFPRSSFVAIDIDQSRYAGFLPDRTIFGPCFLPISDSSVTALSRANSDVGNQREFDIVFVGKVYPNREGFLDELKSSGLRIGVNPHRQDPATRPGYPEYITALGRGHFTVNLSEAGGFPAPQLKSRVLEGPLFGTIICSDESALAQRFFGAGDFVYFDSVEGLKAAVIPLLKDASRLETMRATAKVRARAIASDAFWSTVERGLLENGLTLPMRDSAARPSA